MDHCLYLKNLNSFLYQVSLTDDFLHYQPKQVAFNVLQFLNIREQEVNLLKKNDQYQCLIWHVENLKEYQKHLASLRNSYLHFKE